MSQMVLKRLILETIVMLKSNDDTQKATVSEPENQKDEEVSSTNPKPMTQCKKKTSSTKRLKKGPNTVKDAKA